MKHATFLCHIAAMKSNKLQCRPSCNRSKIKAKDPGSSTLNTQGVKFSLTGVNEAGGNGKAWSENVHGSRALQI